jgi:hypothetical protein
VTVHDVLENVLAQSPASVVATSLAQVSTRFTALAGETHDQIFQLLVTPWLAELRVAVVKRGSPSVALAFFDLWADVLVAARERQMPGFYAHSARPFVASLRHVAHAGLFEEAGGRVLRPLVHVMSAAGNDLGALVHGLSGVARAAGRAGIETGGGNPFALKIAMRMRRAQIEIAEAAVAAGPEVRERVRDRIVLLGEPIAAVIALALKRPELADAAALLSSERLQDERDGEA